MKKIILSIFILLPLFSFAASTDYTLLEPLPPIENSGQSINCDDPNLKMVCKIDSNHYIAYVFNFSIAFASVAAVIVIIIAGFEYATSGIANVKSDAKNRITNAILGLVTILCSYLILKTIDPRLVDISTELPVIEAPGQIFNYDGLADIAEDRINQDLTDAVKQAKPLEQKAASLRAEAAEYKRQAELALSDPEKSGELSILAYNKEQEAKRFENQANMIGSEASLKAVYDLGNLEVQKIGSSNLDNLPIETEIAAKIGTLSGVADRAIKNARDAGDVAGAQKLTDQKNYYAAKLNQDAYLRQKTVFTEELVNGYIARHAYVWTPVVEAYIKKVGNDFNAEISNYEIPSTLKAEDKNKLFADKQEAIRKIEDLSIPKP